MNEKRKPTIEDVAAHEGLALEYTSEASPKFGAQLDWRPDPGFIMVNATHPLYEQRFSIGHELGRFQFARRPAPLPLDHSILNRNYHSHFMKVWMRGARRYMNKRLGAEKRNELFALILMMLLGHKDELSQFLKKHPEMTGWAVYFSLIIIARALKSRFAKVLKQLFTFQLVNP